MYEPNDGPKSPLTFQGATFNVLSVPDAVLKILQRTYLYFCHIVIPPQLPYSSASPWHLMLLYTASIRGFEVPHYFSASPPASYFLTIKQSHNIFCFLKWDTIIQSLAELMPASLLKLLTPPNFIYPAIFTKYLPWVWHCARILGIMRKWTPALIFMCEKTFLVFSILLGKTYS